MLNTTKDGGIKSRSSTVAKNIIFVTLILASLAGLWGCILVYRQQLEMLQARGITGLANLVLIFLGIAVLLMPIHLRMTWKQWTATSMVREYAVRFSLIVGVLFAFL